MATPNKSELVFYTNTPLNDADWKVNWLKVVEWLTTTADVTFGTITVGNITSTGNITATSVGFGIITANSFVGDGSGLTGLNVIGKNYILNPLGQVDTAGTDYTLVKDTYGARADSWEGMATGTAVNAGTLTITEAANTGRTLWAMKFSGATITGTGQLFLRQRLFSEDATKLKNQSVSFQARTYHDVGSAINYKIYFRKADVKDDFSAVTEIANSGNISVPDTTSTQITDEDVSLGDCSNGLEIEIEVNTGAITTKNVELTEIQLEIAATISDFEYRLYDQEAFMNKASVPQGVSMGLKIRQPQNNTALDILNAGTKRSFNLNQNAVSDANTGAAYFYSNSAHVNADSALVKVKQDNSGASEPAVEIIHDGTGYAVETSASKFGQKIVQSIVGGRGIRCERSGSGAESNPFVDINSDNATASQALLVVKQDHASDDSDCVVIQNDGSGNDINAPSFTLKAGGIVTTAASVQAIAANTNFAGHCLDVINDGNATTRQGILIQCGTDDSSGTTTLIDFADGDGDVIAGITNATGTIVYNTFTGGHPSFVVGNKKYAMGTVMVLDKLKVNPYTTKNPNCAQPNYLLKPSYKANDKEVFGIYAERMDGEKHQIYNLGDGVILVTDAGGNIEKGDYLSTSAVVGHAMKQADDLLHNYTIAKSLEAVDWTKEAKTTKLIFCTYHAS